MKKIKSLILYVIVVFCCFCFLACEEETGPQEQLETALTFKLNSLNTVVIDKDYDYKEEVFYPKYNSYELSVDEINSFLVSINKIEFEQVKRDMVSKYSYVITYNNSKLFIIDKNNFVLRDSAHYDVPFRTTEDDFSFLDEYTFILNEKNIEKKITDFTNVSQIKIEKKQSKKQKVFEDSSDIEGFLNNIESIEYVAVKKTIEEDYIYKIVWNDNTIIVYANGYFKYNNELSFCTKSDFNFLDNYEYSENIDTGWLPFI